MQQHTHDPENEQNNHLPAQHISALRTLASDYLELAHEVKALEEKQQVVKDELAAGTLVEVFTIPGLTEEFHAITQRRRFPNPLLRELLEG